MLYIKPIFFTSYSTVGTSSVHEYEHLRLIFCDASRDSIPFVQFKKREKHPLRSITFSNAWKYNNSRNAISFSVSKIYFILLMTLIDSTNDQNICAEFFKATFTH